MVDDTPMMGRFTDVRQLGSGGMGTVFTAYDPERKTRVALKTIKNMDGNSLYMFKREFRSLTDLAHPNLCPLYELLSIDGQWFITMPFIEGTDLMSHLRRRVQRPVATGLPTGAGQTVDLPVVPAAGATAETIDVPDRSALGESAPAATQLHVAREIAPSETPARLSSADGGQRPQFADLCDESALREVFAQVTRGMAALHHAGRLHRDLKPGNVLVTADGHVQVLDFGLVAERGTQETPGPAAAPSVCEAASPHDLAQETMALLGSSSLGDGEGGKIIGTVAYMAPEQAAAAGDLQPACDWYALGVMLFEALTGHLPFEGSIYEILVRKQRQDAPAPATLAEGIPADLNRLCQSLLRRDPAERPTARNILQVLTGIEEDPAAAPAADPYLPFVGRQDLLQRLHEVARQVRNGQPAVVRVHGRSGAGKSLLAQRFLQAQQAARGLVLMGRCYEQESVPYKALDGLLDSLVRELRRLSPSERARCLPTHAAELTRVFPVLQRVPELAQATGDLEAAEAGEIRRRAQHGLRDLLDRLGRRFHLTVAIDDFQWGDTDSVEMLIDLLRGDAPPRLLLLVTYRDEYESRSDCLRDWLAAEPALHESTAVVDLPVGPLSSDEAAALAGQLLPEDHPDRSTLLAAIAREAGGNPLFVIELALSARQGRGLPQQIAGESQSLLDEVLWTRICELPTEVRRLLEVIAVAGHPTRLDVVYDAAGFSVRDPQLLNRLRIDRLVRSSGPQLDSELEAYHDRIRESVVAHLPAAARVQHHAGLAECLERSGTAEEERLAVHFLGAEVPDKAGRYFVLAADKAANALAFDHAVGLYRQALQLLTLPPPEAGALRTRLATALANAGRGEQAAIEFAAAARQVPPERQLDLQRQSAYQYCISGRVELGRAAIRELLQSVGLSMPQSAGATLASLLWQRARQWWRGLDFTPRPAADIDPQVLQQVDLAWSGAAGISMFDILSGTRLSSVTLQLALAAGEPQRIVRSLCWEAVQRINAGGRDVAMGERLINLAETINGSLNDPYPLTMVPFARGIGQFMKGEWRHSVRTLDEAVQTFSTRCRDVHWELGTARLFAHYALYWDGRVAELRRRVTEFHAAAVSRGDFYAELSVGTYDLPFLQMAADAPDEASRLLETYAGRLQLGRYSLQDMFVLMQRTNLALYRGDPATAWRLIHDGWRELRRSLLLLGEHIRMASWELRARAALACLASGHAPSTSRVEAERAIRRIEREQLPRFANLPLLFRAGLAAATGQTTDATRLLERAIAVSPQSAPLFLPAARRQLGKLIGGTTGDELIADADRQMREEGVQAPARFTQMLAPGFPS